MFCRVLVNELLRWNFYSIASLRDSVFSLGEVRDVKKHETGLEASPTGRCSLLERLRINSQSSDHLELATKELWREPACFWGRRGDEFNIIGILSNVCRIGAWLTLRLFLLQCVHG